ncbi:MAG: hypothetical protein M3Q10_04495 [Chloroflexota bacterium]|nr:hypothetical protein [Chloroflexota bacterium]
MGSEAPSATKPKRWTWFDHRPADWPPPDPADLLDRQELLEELRDRGVEVDDVALVFWEKSGVLPRPMRRWRDGAPRALYPRHAIDAVAHLRQLQAAGRSLDEIAPIMRAWELAPTQWEDPYSKPLTAARAALLDLARALNIDPAVIRVTFLDDAGEQIRRSHDIPIPGEWR